MHGFLFTLRSNGGRTRSAIYGSQHDSHEWSTVLVDEVKRKPRNCILLLKYLYNHMHFKTNGYKSFSKTNSTDPGQRVPLIQTVNQYINSKPNCLNVIFTIVIQWQVI